MVLRDVSSVDLARIEELVQLTHERVELAKKVLKNPTDENLVEYNHIVEVHGALREDLCIYPKLTKEEEAASTLWKARKNYIKDW